jgi:hypothetical protein
MISIELMILGRRADSSDSAIAVLISALNTDLLL